METFWFTIPALLGTGLGVGVCAAFTRQVRLKWVLAAALYLALDTLVLIHAPRLDHGQWNWSSKIFSIVFALVTMIALRLSLKEVGLVLPQSRSAWSWSLLCLLGAVLFDGVLNYIFRTHKNPNIATILYEATMPGISEELTYRGIGFALLERAFGGARGRWAKAAPLIVPSLVFGLLHAYTPKGGLSHLEWSGFFFSLPLGLWFAWGRFRTGSLLGPVLAHNAANTVGALVRGL